METVTDFIFLGFKITADGDWSHEIKKCLLLVKWASHVAQVVKNLSANCRTGDGVQSVGQEDLLKEEMVTQSSILAGKWTEEPGGLQSMRSQELDLTSNKQQQ